MTELIKANNVTVTRGKKDILKEISLTIKKRDFITIIGPNGAGKSMLLKALMGFYRTDKGSISKKQNLRVGYVPQHLSPNHSIPVDVSGFLALRTKASKADIFKIAKETSIENILTKPLYVLSGGELQRVLLARALLTDPELLILDEPAQNLDIKGQLGFYRLLEKIYKERELSILMVSHDLHLVMSCSKQVICLFHHICCSGEPKTVTKDPEFISLFGSDMAKMMAVYHHTHNHQHENCDHD